MGNLVAVCLLPKEKCQYQKVRVIGKYGKKPKEVITCRFPENCSLKRTIACQEVEKYVES